MAAILRHARHNISGVLVFRVGFEKDVWLLVLLPWKPIDGTAEAAQEQQHQQEN